MRSSSVSTACSAGYASASDCRWTGPTKTDGAGTLGAADGLKVEPAGRGARGAAARPCERGVEVLLRGTELELGLDRGAGLVCVTTLPPSPSAMTSPGL